MCRGSPRRDASCVSDCTQDPSQLAQVWGPQKREGCFMCCHELRIWRLGSQEERVLGTSPKGGGAEKEAADSREARVLRRRQPELPGVQRPGQVSPVRAGPPQPGKHRGTSELLGKPVLAVPTLQTLAFWSVVSWVRKRGSLVGRGLPSMRNGRKDMRGPEPRPPSLQNRRFEGCTSAASSSQENTQVLSQHRVCTLGKHFPSTS